MMAKTLDRVDDESASRQYIFTSMVIRFKSSTPAPFSILSVPFDVLRTLFHSCQARKSQGLLERTKRATMAASTQSEMEVESQRDKCLNLKSLKEEVDNDVIQQQKAVEESMKGVARKLENLEEMMAVRRDKLEHMERVLAFGRTRQ